MINVIDLSGEWGFSFGGPACDDTIMLPSTTAQSHKGKLSDAEEEGYLTELYPYLGKACFKRKVTVPARYSGCSFRLFLERTRVTSLKVNGGYVGSLNYLTVPHCYDITPFIEFEGSGDAEAELEITVSNDCYPIGGGHMTSPDTQTNWLGILGRMELQIFGSVYVQGCRVLSDTASKSLEFSCAVHNGSGSELPCSLAVSPSKTELEGLMLPDGKNYFARAEELASVISYYPVQTFEFTAAPGDSEISFKYIFDKNASVLWSEHSPYIMEAELTLRTTGGADGSEAADRLTVFAGVKSFKAGTHDFMINGLPTKLRGKHDALLFPITGAAPMDLLSWLKVMGTAWRYGINHYRYHTCCPPEAAFAAADMLGIYMEPELPFWGTVPAPGEEGFNETEQNYLIEEGKRILTAYGNHPSFCMMSMGNELWGSRERINEIIGILKAHDDRPLYTEGSNNFQFIPEVLPLEDFFVGARLAAPVNGENKRLIRGSFATCDAPLGIIQTKAPSTAESFDAAIMSGNGVKYPDNDTESNGADQDAGGIAIQYGTGVKIVESDGSDSGVTASLPIVGHEIGQYFIYPDYSQLSKYTGVLAPRSLELFRKRLEEKGMSGQARDFFLNSGRLSVACYREELEMMHRSRYMAGYQLLDLQDFTGQGTALVGVLDAFMDSKGLISEDAWRRFCSDAVLLASFEKYIYTEGEAFSADIIISMFNPLFKTAGRRISWSLSMENTAALNGSLDITDNVFGTEKLGKISFSMPVFEAPGARSAKAVLSVRIDGTDILNEYTLWLYPGAETEIPAVACCETEEDAVRLASRGKNSIFFNECPDGFIPGFYCADFWNYTMFRQISESMGRPVAVGTLGLNIASGHEALSGFACESYSTPQWYSMVSACKCAILDGRGDIKPIVEMIDNPWRAHRLGIIYELDSGFDGKILVCTIPRAALESCPEGRALYRSLAGYLS